MALDIPFFKLRIMQWSHTPMKSVRDVRASGMKLRLLLDDHLECVCQSSITATGGLM